MRQARRTLWRAWPIGKVVCVMSVTAPWSSLKRLRADSARAVVLSGIRFGRRIVATPRFPCRSIPNLPFLAKVLRTVRSPVASRSRRFPVFEPASHPMNAPSAFPDQQKPVPPYRHTPLFPLGPDTTPYKKVTADGGRVEKGLGKDMLVVWRARLRALSEAAFGDINHYLRPGH